MRTWASAFLASALLLAAAPAQQSVPTPAQDSTYNATVAPVRRSPPAAAHLLLSPGETVVALNVAAHAPIAAAIVAAAAGRYEVRLWDVAQNLSRTVWQAPAGTRLSALVWDPAAPTAVLYLLARTSSQSQLLKLAQAKRGWAATTLFASLPDLRRLVISPRPFDGKLRLYFGQRKPDGSYRILSITAKGTRLYQLIGPKSTRIKINDPQIDGQPTSIPVPSALPVSFHPAGNRLIWEDSHGCFQSLVYGFKDWNGVRSVAGGRLCGGGWLAPTPNGLGLLAWHSGTSGVTLYLDHAQIARPQATADRFLLPPASVPDGRGIVGAVQMGARQALAYVPIQVPLADVVNAWMFATTPSDRRHLIRDAGLFRPFASTSPTNNDQLYSLYDSELYLCGGLNDEIPTRPYLVTTDLIWEVYGAAYHGLFTITERQQAIPAFWRFVAAARAALQREHPQSPWNTVFATIGALRHPPPHPTGEVARILQAPGGLMQQPQFLRPMDYSQLRPRGFYTTDPGLRRYFRAFRYLTQVAALPRNLDDLASLPPAVKRLALAWIAAYAPFIAPPRQPLVWENAAGQHPPAYAAHPSPRASVFPLSWGFDNEVLDSTVYHRDWPPAEQITGVNGPRLLPSGLDLADALGNHLAASLLQPQLQEFGRLGPVLGRLRQAQSQAAPGAGQFYGQWLAALKAQWAPTAPIPGTASSALWDRKRLQTGLASWATLRHTTILVNDESAAECGEGGFEELATTPPRGYVEPDPATFGAMAQLFDSAAALVAGGTAAWPSLGQQPSAEDLIAAGPLRQGILERLRDAAATARHFQAIATKELRGQPLTPADYLAILYAGRAGEYNFLVFKSLANPHYALSIPDPLPKIADVAGKTPFGYLSAAVGPGMEWDQIVPYFGRREIVKGSVYSYYEFPSPTPLTDQQWRAALAQQQPPDWIAPYLVPTRLQCPAPSPY